MLFRKAVLSAISAGEITCAFRRWRKPIVREGGQLRTPAGVLVITELAGITADDISDADAMASGYVSRNAVLQALEGDGTLYRIRFRLEGEDPRARLRENAILDAEECAALTDRLDAMDRRSALPWAWPAMRIIGGNEGMPAGEIADRLGLGKALLKNNIRKLKEFGLTESLETGYRLSPRGRTLLAAKRD